MSRQPGKPPSPWDSISEQMLVAAAIRIELPPSKHAILEQRKAAIEKHLERDGSPLKGMIRLFYQQGSVAIGATIRSKFRADGYDIDIIVELKRYGLKPWNALDLLYRAVRGEPGSKYYKITKRQTRCVTVQYEDGMHIDLSPSELINERDPRYSYIYHSKPEDPRINDRKVPTNSHAFVDEFNGRCPIDLDFHEEYSRRALAENRDYVPRKLRDADSKPVPDHSSLVGGKSAVTVALQLIKRFLSIRYHDRNGRRPPSVMISSLVLEIAGQGRTIGENLKIAVEHIVDRLVKARDVGMLIQVRNPRCREDVFTDRWPGNSAAQDTLIEDMQLFLKQLDVLLDVSKSIADKQKALRIMFGEDVGQSVVESLKDKYGEIIRSGKHVAGTLGGIASIPAAAKASPIIKPSTFYSTNRPLSLALLHSKAPKQWKSILDQRHSMARNWPQFKCCQGLHPHSVSWLGALKGLERTFQIHIMFGLPKPGLRLQPFRIMPIVQVLQPSLIPNPGAEEEAPLPHVYPNPNNPTLSPLCLFDPKANEWNHSMLISKTTIYWTMRWLAAYEFWEATGRWNGGGRHD